MLKYWMVIVCFMSLLLQSVNGCPSQCNCQDDNVVCTNKNIRNPPKTYPAGTKTVNLNQNRITVLGPRSFQRHQTLEIMKINGNNIRVIRAYAFRPFTNLLTLDLSNNQIVKIYGRAFKGMNKVRTLSLSNNRLRSVTRIFLSTPKLFQLTLGYNDIRKLGEGDFGANSDLHYLDLRNNKISTIHRNTFKNLVNLRTLFLNNNPLTNLPGELKFGSQVLQLLDFSFCQLTVIPKGIPASTEDLRFGNNRLTRINQSDLANVTGLKMITFNENQIERFEYFALGNARNLEEVWLRANKLVYIPRGFPDSVKKVHMHSNMVHQIEGRLFTEASQLEYLDISNNQVSNISNEAFTGLMKLQTIKFEGNQLSDLKPGTFESLQTLQSIYLGNNPIETIQAGAFRNLPNLTTLTLNYNPNEEVQVRENFLLEMPNLEILNLMASIGMSKTILEIVRDNDFVMTYTKEVILTYNNLRKIPSSFRDTFPNIEKLPLDGNAWICDHELLWLKQWMQSTIGEITFHEYSPPKCETPFGLSGSHIIDVRDSDFQEHNQGLLNDFPYWVIEEEFNKAQDEKEKRALEEKEKKEKYAKHKDNQSKSKDSKVIPKDTESNSKDTKSNSKDTKSNSKVTAANTKGTKKDPKDQSKDHQNTKDWYHNGKNHDQEKIYYNNKESTKLNKEMGPQDKKDSLEKKEKIYQTKDHSSNKKQTNNKENQKKMHSTNRKYFKTDRDPTGHKQNHDKKWLRNEEKPKRRGKPESKERIHVKKDKISDRELFDKDKIKHHNKDTTDSSFPKYNNASPKAEHKKNWVTNAKKEKGNQKDQKNPVNEKDKIEGNMKTISKDNNRKKLTDFPKHKKNHNSEVKPPTPQTDLDKSFKDGYKDSKISMRKVQRKRKRKDRRRKCERNGKKCRKRKRKGRKYRKAVKIDKL